MPHSLVDLFLINRTPRLFGRLNDEEWFATIVATLGDRCQRGLILPGLPSEDLQQRWVGSAGEHALREDFNFYVRIRDTLDRLGRKLQPETRVLDFGCGWGRMLRFFLREVEARNLHGVDVAADMVSFCRKTFGKLARFDVVPYRPPAPTLLDSYDVIYLYSVFSHLNREVHLAWVGEFARRLKPGGLIFATTQGRDFINFCDRLRTAGTLDSDWHRILAKSFPDREKSLADYDAGEFVHQPLAGGDWSSFYGESVVPRAFVEKHWQDSLRLIEFLDDPLQLPQALIVAQKI